ncbi:MAG: GxxExxY protein [Prosthecobacter sp.]
MPIIRTLDIQSVTDADFDIIDEAVIRCAYATQNKFGRLFDERIYENDLAARLRAEGFEVHTQVPVKVVHGSFEKTYYLDLVVNHMLYELKVTAALLPEHEAQGLHYAMLQDIRRVKLINFGDGKVRGKLLRNALTTPERHQPKMRTSGWRILTPQCERLVTHLKQLIQDWGTHLDSHLYSEALVHHFGGELHCLQRLDFKTENLKLGTHLVQLFSPAHAFVVTAFPSHQAAYQKHLEVLLDHVALDGIQWINLNHSRLEVTTLERMV